MENNSSEGLQPINFFISYSSKDKPFRDDLENHLSTMKAQGVINTWQDGLLDGGDEWDAIIQNKLKTANVILLLVSADFLASKYIRRVEIEEALKRHKADETKVIPIILRPCDWEEENFGKFQALPDKGKAITRWDDRDEAFTNIAKGIRKIVEKSRNP